MKQCCARLYESDFAKLLLGDSFHPGGTEAHRSAWATLLELTPQSRVLDICLGQGHERAISGGAVWLRGGGN